MADFFTSDSSRCRWETFRSEVSSRYSRSRRLRHVDLRAKIIPPSYAVVQTFKNAIEFAHRCAEEFAGSILSLSGHREKDRLQTSPFSS